MGFRDDYHTTYPVRAELVKSFVNDRGSDLFSSVMQTVPKIIYIIEHLPIAVSEF